MRNSPILFFDSGIGGLTTLLEVQKIMFLENFVYVADFLNSPYGNKTKKQIFELAYSSILKYIKKYKPKCVVLACNTLTSVAIKLFRKKFSIPFVGCEPAVKVAKKDNKKNVLVLCTRATKKYSKYLKHTQNITIFSPNKLSKLVDENYLENKNLIVKYLKKQLKKFLGFDAAVLGCTHYVLLKKEIENILNAKAYEGNTAIANRIFKIIPKSTHKIGKTTLISTKKDRQKLLNESYRKIKGEKLCVELRDMLENKIQ